MATAAAVPTAWPSSAQVAMTREALIAVCVTEMFRPAKKRFSTLWEYRHRYGIPNGEGAGWKMLGAPLEAKPAGS